MSDQNNYQDEVQELREYMEAARELEAARAIEAAEFIRENAEEDESEDESIRLETQEAPPAIIADESARHQYWQAHGLVELEQINFSTALEQDDFTQQRSAYFRLAVYHGRTIYILRSALNSGKEPLAQATMRNLATLHRAMMQMHKRAPHNVPVALLLDRRGRDDFARDLVMRALQESTVPLGVDEILQRVNDLNIMGSSRGTVQRHLKDLVESGYVETVKQQTTGYQHLQRIYTEMDMDASGLRAIVGSAMYDKMAQAGFNGLKDVLGRQASFRDLFCQLTGFEATSAALFIDLVETLLEDRGLETSTWSFTDLIGSPYPRPYQYEAYAVFRGYGYHGQLVEAPTGSGKTMIGMMCIQDWLNQLRPGQSILILVPTSNYLQQWSGELCYKPIGLRLSPEMVFAGTPNQLERFQKRTGSHPAIILMTYTALSQAGSGIGKGGFDVDSIEMFLQGANVQYIVLDEVHKVAENLKSVSSDVIRLVMEWLNDGSVQGLIGFTGTAEAYRSRFGKLGLQLVYSIPIDELIAAGFVAPFAELGAAFSYSERERHIRDLLDLYKEHTSAYMNLVGGQQLRQWFAQIPMDERVSIGHDLLNMYQERKDWKTALPKRLAEWETGESLRLTETKVVTMVQISRKWSDIDLIRAAEADEEKFWQLVEKINEVRNKLTELIYLPSTLERLQIAGFAARFDVEGIQHAAAQASSQTEHNEAIKNGLATTIVGMYEGLREWYRRVGEGRVETIKAIIEAERAVRKVDGTIVFDTARCINWKSGTALPGYEGVGGLYAQLLGDSRFQPYAVLSREQYLPYDESDPLPPRIATFIEQEIMQVEIGRAMFDLVFQGVEIGSEKNESLYDLWEEVITRYIPRLKNVHAARPGDFSRGVLRPMRKRIRKMDLGLAGERVLSRLDLRNIHFADLVNTFFDYAIIARYFRQAKVAELEQVSGVKQKFFVIPMPAGSRKLLMYDLTSRIVDAEALPINIVIVSSWARTGWNVITPNLLVDATATRDVTAWQQLRGRAIRARRTWTNDCYRLIMALIGSQMSGLESQEDLLEDVSEVMADLNQHQQPDILDENLQKLLTEVASKESLERIHLEGLASLSTEERTQIAINLMHRFNKVTHIYELVKAFGSTSQVEFNRADQVWQRRETIAIKHEHEIAVNPFTGEKLTGDGHAPLTYVQDPRSDIPSVLQQHLQQKIQGCDDVIVSGWLRVM